MPLKVEVFVIGGGINGTAIAADAAGRGLSVAVCEQNDLASGTSSASSKLIHGGLRYLESYEFHLVYSALKEREILFSRAPHLITPLEFILPYGPHLRPAWLIRLGLFLYDFLSIRKKLPRSKSLKLIQTICGNGLLPHIKNGFSYYDGFTDDAKLVILNALSAKKNGARILTHTQLVKAEREKNHWKIHLKNCLTQETYYYYATVLINVAGPWVNEVQQCITSSVKYNIAWVKGSHIVVPRLYEGDFAYILQNQDKRIVFVLPFEEKFTLIGTTDMIVGPPLGKVVISPAEQKYLCDVINQYFKVPINKNNILWSYSGVRCLQASTCDNPAKMSRDYKLILDTENNLPLLVVIGGKLTTHRSLAEKAVNTLRGFFPKMGPAWTAHSTLPGGEIPSLNIFIFKQEVKSKFSWLPLNVLERYVRSYGTRLYLFLNSSSSLQDLGENFGQGLFEKEVKYLIAEEWAHSAEDILWRRTKLGLVFSPAEKAKLENWLSLYWLNHSN